VKLRTFAAHGNHLFDDFVGRLDFAIFNKRKRKRIVEGRILSLYSNDFSQQRGCFRVIRDHEIAQA